MLTQSRWKLVLVALAVVFGLLFALPNALPKDLRDGLPGFMPDKTLNLGLDLQGGSYLLLEVDTNALRSERLTNMVEDIRTQLGEKQIAFSGLGVSAGAVNVRITDPADVPAAARQLRENIGAAMAGVAGGRDVTVAIEADQRLRLSFVPAAFEAEAIGLLIDRDKFIK